MGAANRKGVINVMAQLGWTGFVTADVLRRTERGLRRILQALGMLPGFVPDTAQGTRALNARRLAYAYDAGIFEPLKVTVALIHHPETPVKAPDAVLSPYAWIALAVRAMAQVRRGDALYHIAADAS
jgi:hypothetical protein